MKRPPFYKSVYYAFKGLFWMLKTERNFQLEVLALVINLFLMVYFQLNSTDAVLTQITQLKFFEISLWGNPKFRRTIFCVFW